MFDQSLFCLLWISSHGFDLVEVWPMPAFWSFGRSTRVGDILIAATVPGMFNWASCVVEQTVWVRSCCCVQLPETTVWIEKRKGWED